MPEFIDPVFPKTSPKRSFSVIQNERFGLVFAKTGSIISGTVVWFYRGLCHKSQTSVVLGNYSRWKGHALDDQLWNWKKLTFLHDYERCNRDLISSWKKIMFSPKSCFETCTAKTKYRNKYSLKMNIGVSVPISTFMCLWANYIFLRSAYILLQEICGVDRSIAHRHMNVEIGTEAAQCPEKECINGIFVAVRDSPTPGICVRRAHGSDKFYHKFTGRRRVMLSVPTASAGILEQSMGARNQVGIGLTYRPARLHRLVESIPGLLKCLKIPSHRTWWSPSWGGSRTTWQGDKQWCGSGSGSIISIESGSGYGSESGSRILMTKNEEKCSWFLKIFSLIKNCYYLSQTFIKDFQATEDAFSTSKD